MNVAAILKQKGRTITTARPTVTLMEVANKLAAKRIGAIVIVGAGGEVTGIISERDIIRAFDDYHARQNGKLEDGVGEALDPDAPKAAGPQEIPAPDAATDDDAPNRGPSL